MIVGMVLSIGLYSLNSMAQSKSLKSVGSLGSPLNRNVSSALNQSNSSSSSSSQAEVNKGVINKAVLAPASTNLLKVESAKFQGYNPTLNSPSTPIPLQKEQVAVELKSVQKINQESAPEEVVEEKIEEVVEQAALEKDGYHNKMPSAAPQVSFGYNRKGELACSVLENGERLIYKTDDLSSTPCFKLAKAKKLVMPKKTFWDEIAKLEDLAPFWTEIDGPIIAKQGSSKNNTENGNNNNSLLTENNEQGIEQQQVVNSPAPEESPSNQGPNCSIIQGKDGMKIASTCIQNATQASSKITNTSNSYLAPSMKINIVSPNAPLNVSPNATSFNNPQVKY